MSIWASASKADRQKIRREMLRQAEAYLKSVGITGQIKSAARQMVDSALAQERNGHTQSIDAQQPTVQ